MSMVSIVVPVFNNEKSLPDLLAQFIELASKNSSDEFEFVFVDDGSSDQSYTVLNDLFQREPRLRIIKLSRNFGSNAALMAGMSQARGDVVAVIAADLQDPPELIEPFFEKWQEGYDVVYGVRVKRDATLFLQVA